MRVPKRISLYENLETCNYMGSEDEWDDKLDSNDMMPIKKTNIEGKSRVRTSI